MILKYVGDFTFNESGAVRHQPNTSYTYPYKIQIVFLYNYNMKFDIFMIFHSAFYCQFL